MAFPDQILLVSGCPAAVRSPRNKASPARLSSRRIKHQQHEDPEHRDQHPVHVAEQYGGGFHADFEIVVPIHHGMVPAPTGWWRTKLPATQECAGLGAKAIGTAQPKARPQIGLRQIGVAFSKG